MGCRPYVPVITFWKPINSPGVPRLNIAVPSLRYTEFVEALKKQSFFKDMKAGRWPVDYGDLEMSIAFMEEGKRKGKLKAFVRKFAKRYKLRIKGFRNHRTFEIKPSPGGFRPRKL